MCGIAGEFAYGGSVGVDPALLTRMRETMVARGPDGMGQWVSEDHRIGLAHRRLAIIDLSDNAAQPMASADGRLRIVYNGEIYNYRALKKELETEGVVFRTGSDTEVILRLYERLGRECVKRLRGMFAFAIWDQEKRGLFLARDQFGIKPLYVADDGDRVVFASQVGAILARGGIDTSPEPAGHAGFFLWGSVPEPFTLYRGIRALPAGGTLWVDEEEGVLAPKRYWTLNQAMRRARETPIAPKYHADTLAEALRESVRRHLVADVDVGVFLSAGRDSGALAGLAAEMKAGGGKGLKTVTLGFREFQGGPRDEVPLAESVSQCYGTRQHTHWISGEAFAEELDSLLAAMDQPSIDGVNTYFVSKATAQSGLKVALSGIGGDELFAGYDNFIKIPEIVDSIKMTRHLPGLGRMARVMMRATIGRFLNPKAPGVLEYGGTYGGAYLLRRGLYMPWELRRLLGRDMARAGLRELALPDRLDAWVRGIHDPLRKVSILEMGGYMRNQLLRDADWAGMAHSLEIRVPFVDVDLVETVLHMRAGVADEEGEGRLKPDKADMAATPKPPLPDKVLHRAKTGFGIPVERWLLKEADQERTRKADAYGLRGWARYLYKAKNQSGKSPA